MTLSNTAGINETKSTRQFFAKIQLSQAIRIVREAKTKSKKVNRNIEILCLYYDEYTYEQIGVKHSITLERVRQIMSSLRKTVQKGQADDIT